MLKDLIVFADYGLDDAAATATLFNHRDSFGGITIVPIGGNVPPEISLRNCITLLNTLDVNERITVIDTTAICQPSEYLKEIHGNDGMGDVLEARDSRENADIIPFDEWITAIRGDETLLSLGPMTVVKTVMQKYPGCPLVLMGGCVDEEPNFNGYEFNQALDTEAFAYCVGYPHVAITLDTCRTKKLDMRRLTIVGEDIHSRILRADQRLSITRGEDGCYVWDDVAVCYLLHPERFITECRTDRGGNILTQAKYIAEEEYFE